MLVDGRQKVFYHPLQWDKEPEIVTGLLHGRYAVVHQGKPGQPGHCFDAACMEGKVCLLSSEIRSADYCAITALNGRFF